MTNPKTFLSRDARAAGRWMLQCDTVGLGVCDASFYLSSQQVIIHREDKYGKPDISLPIAEFNAVLGALVEYEEGVDEDPFFE